jgi:hypothetical protein
MRVPTAARGLTKFLTADRLAAKGADGFVGASKSSTAD